MVKKTSVDIERLREIAKSIEEAAKLLQEVLELSPGKSKPTKDDRTPEPFQGLKVNDG